MIFTMRKAGKQMRPCPSSDEALSSVRRPEDSDIAKLFKGRHRASFTSMNGLLHRHHAILCHQLLPVSIILGHTGGGDGFVALDFTGDFQVQGEELGEQIL